MSLPRCKVCQAFYAWEEDQMCAMCRDRKTEQCDADDGCLFGVVLVFMFCCLFLALAAASDMLLK